MVLEIFFGTNCIREWILFPKYHLYFEWILEEYRNLCFVDKIVCCAWLIGFIRRLIRFVRFIRCMFDSIFELFFGTNCVREPKYNCTLQWMLKDYQNLYFAEKAECFSYNSLLLVKRMKICCRIFIVWNVLQLQTCKILNKNFLAKKNIAAKKKLSILQKKLLP